ncbi:hypothetical protein SAMN04488128_107172 [Chitinophaga eiseniae]|uniref:Uncharacterized protein n=1 Tax=Chitinophaga eiseniae TaxID=634771 RepID=A0A1T4U0M8_9BACT|nr:hypothetical protein SAMN04488128_107172 [Chitinophaga eiseniae]
MKKEKRFISEGLHQSLIILFAGVIILLLLIKTIFL